MVIFVMAMKIKSFFYLILSTLILSSCERTVVFELDEVNPKLVIEGTIENNQAPIISLTKSLNYFSAIDPAILSNSFVHNADVYVSNGTLTHKLKEYSISITPTINYYYYSNDPSNPTTAFLGQLNSSYSLRIVSEGKEYTAITTIPNTTRRIDSLFWKQAPPGNPVTKVELRVKATDAPGFGDYIRYFTKQNSDPFFPGLNSVYDDQVIDGTSYEIQVERGIPRTGSTPDNYSLFDKGDTVTLKLCNIDKPTYDFWRTMEFTYASVGNPFSSPTKVISNIKGGGLGYFGGYAAQYHTIIIPR